MIVKYTHTGSSELCQNACISSVNKDKRTKERRKTKTISCISTFYLF